MEQLEFDRSESRPARVASNRVRPEDRLVHDWYRFVLSFPPHLVQEYFSKFDVTSKTAIMDPFCGTGTTLVECKKSGVDGYGVEANPAAFFASKIKLDWDIDAENFVTTAESTAAQADEVIREWLKSVDDISVNDRDLRDFPEDIDKLLLKNSISPIPLHKSLILRDIIEENMPERFRGHARLCLAKELVSTISNLRFGPEVGIGKRKEDAPVVAAWLQAVRVMAHDIASINRPQRGVQQVFLGDAREASRLLPPNSIDIVLTSPPYPNEKDYSRTTRLESVFLGFIRSKSELRDVKKSLIRSNTRGVYKSDTDDELVRDNQSVQELVQKIEATRIELGKTSGFERMYARVTGLYFGGMARHLSDLRPLLRPGARLGYVVGDQASYFRIMIRTGRILAEIARSLGYEVESIDLFRTRPSTVTKSDLREEVVVLRWP